jgi:hypothetical protein
MPRSRLNRRKDLHLRDKESVRATLDGRIACVARLVPLLGTVLSLLRLIRPQVDVQSRNGRDGGTSVRLRLPSSGADS